VVFIYNIIKTDFMKKTPKNKDSFFKPPSLPATKPKLLAKPKPRKRVKKTSGSGGVDFFKLALVAGKTKAPIKKPSVEKPEGDSFFVDPTEPKKSIVTKKTVKKTGSKKKVVKPIEKLTKPEQEFLLDLFVKNVLEKQKSDTAMEIEHLPGKETVLLRSFSVWLEEYGKTLGVTKIDYPVDEPSGADVKTIFRVNLKNKNIEIKETTDKAGFAKQDFTVIKPKVEKKVGEESGESIRPSGPLKSITPKGVEENSQDKIRDLAKSLQETISADKEIMDRLKIPKEAEKVVVEKKVNIKPEKRFKIKGSAKEIPFVEKEKEKIIQSAEQIGLMKELEGLSDEEVIYLREMLLPGSSYIELDEKFSRVFLKSNLGDLLRRVPKNPIELSKMLKSNFTEETLTDYEINTVARRSFLKLKENDFRKIFYLTSELRKLKPEPGDEGLTVYEFLVNRMK